MFESVKQARRLNAMTYPTSLLASLAAHAAIIDEEGNVSNLRILSGHPLLTSAAVEAVSRWRYSPTILNGEPVPVSAIVTVVFRLR